MITKNTLKENLKKATSSLIDMAKELCWNTISDDCVYIISEIDDSVGNNFIERAKIRKKNNDKKTPKSLSEIIPKLHQIFDNLYDINLYIYRALPNKTIIEIRYFLKTSHTPEYYPTIKNNPPMLHCKVATPPYASDFFNTTKMKFDIHWELDSIRHQWKLFWYRLRYKLKLHKI